MHPHGMALRPGRVCVWGWGMGMGMRCVGGGEDERESEEGKRVLVDEDWSWGGVGGGAYVWEEAACVNAECGEGIGVRMRRVVKEHVVDLVIVCHVCRLVIVCVGASLYTGGGGHTTRGLAPRPCPYAQLRSGAHDAQLNPAQRQSSLPFLRLLPPTLPVPQCHP